MAITKVTNPVTDFDKSTNLPGLKIPSGDNANEPIGAAAVQGMIRNDTDETVDSSDSAIAHYNATAWKYFAATESFPGSLLMYLDASNTTSYPPPQTGSTWYDLTTNGNNGAITGASWNPAGYFSFDGSNDRVSLPLNLQGTAFSVSFWAKDTLDSNNYYLIANNSGSTTSGWHIGGANGGGTKYNFRINNPSTGFDFSIESAQVTDSAWHQVVVTWNNTTNANGAKFYINGQPNSQGTSSSTTNFGFTNSTTQVMAMDIYYSNGSLNRLQFHDTALTSAEVYALYLEGKGF